MGLYAEQVLPRIINVGCGMKVTEPLRRRVCEGLAGDVVEIGFGTGHNVPFYPGSIAHVAAVEPADLGWKLAGKRLAGTSVPVQRSGLDGQSLPFADDSYDAALSTCPVIDLLTTAGFTITELDVFYEDGAPKFLGADSLGIAQAP